MLLNVLDNIKKAVMGRIKTSLKSRSLKSKLVLGFTVLMVAVLIPVLFINLLSASSAGAPGEGTGEPQNTADLSNPSSTEGADEDSNQNLFDDIVVVGESAATFTSGTDWARDPATAAEDGIQGYVEFIFVDDPDGVVLHRGEAWTGTVLLRLVSHTPDLTEVKINVDPQHSPTWGGTIVDVKSGARSFGGLIAGVMVNFTALLSYNPNGTFVIRAGESLTLTLSIAIPVDFPQEVDEVRLSPLGIWEDNRSVLFIESPDFVTKKVFVR